MDKNCINERLLAKRAATARRVQESRVRKAAEAAAVILQVPHELLIAQRAATAKRVREYRAREASRATAISHQLPSTSFDGPTLPAVKNIQTLVISADELLKKKRAANAKRVREYRARKAAQASVIHVSPSIRELLTESTVFTYLLFSK